MQHIISLQAKGTISDICASAEATARTTADSMPQPHKDALARQFLAHYFVLLAARSVNPDTNTPEAEAIFDTLSSILETSGITIVSASSSSTSNN